jgi:hypothetical protein
LVEFILGDRVEMEQLAQRVAEGIGMKSARGGELGCWLQDASRDQGQDEIAIAVGMLIEKAVEMQLAQGTEDGGDVAMRAGADDVEGLRQRGTEGGIALQDGAERIDFGWGPVGEIGDGAVVDLAILAEALTQEDSGRGVAVGDDGDVHVDRIRELIRLTQGKSPIYMTT